MLSIFLIAFFVAFLMGLFLFFQRGIRPGKKAQPYVVKTSLLTSEERSFLGCLDSVISSDIRVFAQVRLADIFNVERTPDRSAWRSAFNKINSKHVDFLLCRAADLCPILAIELDDKTHEREDRQKGDAFKNEIFAASRLPLLRFKVRKVYRTEDIAQRLNKAMEAAQ